MAPVITSVRRAAHDRVAVELDGQAWRVLPESVVVEVGLAPGEALDRRRAARLSRALRREHATSAALGALRRADHTQSTLAARLQHVAPALRGEVIDRLTEVGLVDDERFAERRALLLAARGAGNHLIQDDLERRGVANSTIRAVLDALPPERVRADDIAQARGISARTARYLAARGFDEDVVSSTIAEPWNDGIG
jgi:SOS response regulatory protein OraA/RecX